MYRFLFFPGDFQPENPFLFAEGLFEERFLPLNQKYDYASDPKNVEINNCPRYSKDKFSSVAENLIRSIKISIKSFPVVDSTELLNFVRQKPNKRNFSDAVPKTLCCKKCKKCFHV